MTRVTRLALPLFLVTCCAGAAWIALGAPDFGAVANFEGGSYPTQAGALAAVILLAWVPIVAVGVAILVLMGRAAWLGAEAKEWARKRRMAVSLVLVVGAVVLTVGLGRHFMSTPPLHGGSVNKAQQLLQEHQP